jgi:hypothetical protein
MAAAEHGRCTSGAFKSRPTNGISIEGRAGIEQVLFTLRINGCFRLRIQPVDATT